MSKRKLQQGLEESKSKRAKFDHDDFQQKQLEKLEKDDKQIERLYEQLRAIESERYEVKQRLKDSFLNMSESKSQALAAWAKENKVDLSNDKKFIINQLEKNIQPQRLLEWTRQVVLNRVGYDEDDIWVQLFMRLKLLNRMDLQYRLEIWNPAREYSGVTFAPVFDIKELPADSIKKMMILFQVPLYEMFTSSTSRGKIGLSIHNDLIWKGRIADNPSDLRYRPLLIAYLSSPSISKMVWDMSSIERILDWFLDHLYDETTMVVSDQTGFGQDMLYYRELNEDTKSDWISKYIHDERRNFTDLWKNKNNADDPSFDRKNIAGLDQVKRNLHSRGAIDIIQNHVRIELERKQAIEKEKTKPKSLDQDEVESSEITPTPEIKSDVHDMVAMKFQNSPKRYFVMPVILAQQIPEIKELMKNVQLNSVDQKRKAQEYERITPEVIYDSDEEESKGGPDFSFDFARFGDVKYFLDFSGPDSIFDSIQNFPRVWNHFIKFLVIWASMDWPRPHLLLDRHFPMGLQMDANWGSIDTFMYSSTTFLFASISMTDKHIKNWDYETWNGVHTLSQFLQVSALAEMIEMYFSIFLMRPLHELPIS